MFIVVSKAICPPRTLSDIPPANIRLRYTKIYFAKN